MTGQARFDGLRERHPRLIYRSCSVEWSGDDLRLGCEFLLEPDVLFRPHVTVRGAERARREPPELVASLAFHLGLAELPSYWKAACPPEIVVEAGGLSAAQRAWWGGLLVDGLSEFWFVNGLDPAATDLVAIRAEDPESTPGGSTAPPWSEDARRAVLIPVSGGKDSAVASAVLADRGIRLGAMLLNPNAAARSVVGLGGWADVVTVARRIDPVLLALNAEGYLNGHTPFTAYLSVLGLTLAGLLRYGRVALAGERSSDEGNLVHRGRLVNHQFAKSFDFEQRFQAYVRDHVPLDVHVFSFLRPLYELQIARLFADLPAYHPVFRSCNRGAAQNVWCESCPKCLSVYLLLYPFLGPEGVRRIWRDDLFERTDLLPLALGMLGIEGPKPFECVGTVEESRVAAWLSRRRALESGGPVPSMLEVLWDRSLGGEADMPTRAEAVLTSWSDRHAVPPDLSAPLRARVLAAGGVPVT